MKTDFDLNSQRRCGLLSCLLLALILCLPAGARAAFYKYIDQEGNPHFVDDLSKVPPQYSETIDVYNEKYDNLPADQRAQKLRQERQRQLEMEAEHQRQLQLQLRQERQQEAEERKRQAQAAREKYRKSLETSVIIKNNRILVPATLGNNGQQVEALLLLDTGASHLTLLRSVATRLHIVTLQKGLSQLADGKTVQTEMGRLGFIRIGPLKLENAAVIIIPDEGPATAFNGLLGMNILSGVHYTIDYQNQLIRWQPLPEQKVQK